MTLRSPLRPRLPRLRPAVLAAGLLGWSLAHTPVLQAQEIGKSPALSSKTPVTLNFVNADIDAVTRAMAVMLDRQILVDPRVKGAITLYSDQPLLVREAYLNYLAALRGMGFTVVEVGGLLKVVPEADAKLQTGTVSIGEVGRKGDQIITQIFQLRHESANNLVAVLRPLISPNNTINANAASNSLVITDYADNLSRLGKIIASMDTPAQTDVEVIALRHAVAADLAPMLQKLVDGSGGGAAAQGGAPAPAAAAATGGAVSILTDLRSNSIVVRTPNPTRMSLVRSLIDKLDRPSATGGPAGNIYVVHLKNADAVKLATVLRAAYTAGSANSGTGTGGGGLTGFGGAGTGTQTANTATAGGTTGTGAGQSVQATSPVAQSASPSTGGFVQADPATNSLIITASEPMYRQLRTLIDQLDGRRAQVYIESMIVEVRGDNSADFGFQWQGLLGQNGDKWGLAGGTNFTSTGNILDLTSAALGGSSTTTGTGTSSSAATTVSSLLGNGLNVALIKDFGGTYGLAAIARFMQTQTNTNIVSTPNLITLDNEEAKIIVGSNVPFVTGQYTSTGTATTNPFQTIERKDVGITLRIKPQIGENGVVRMVLYQESSSVSSQTAPGTTNAGPTTDKRSIESTIVVDDGQIVVLGGLIEDRYSNTQSKVPLLGDIPYLGNLFRSESRQKVRTNLMVFLRPVVMRDADTTNRVSLDRYDLIRSQQSAAQPVPNLLLPVGQTPVLPPLRAVEDTTLPLSVTPSAPGAPAPAASAPAN